MGNNSFVCGSLFEGDCIIRPLGGMVSHEKNQRLTVGDHGTGMSNDDFHNRGMKYPHGGVEGTGYDDVPGMDLYEQIQLSFK
jgi:hypothetical protein